MKCQYCNKEFSRKESLSRHINFTHLNKNKQIFKIKCDYCNTLIAKNFFIKHLINEHNMSLVDAVINSEIKNRKKFNINISNELLSIYLYKINSNVQIKKDIKYYERQFNSFYKMITTVETFTVNHIELFINTVLPWKLSHPKNANNKELTKLIYPNDNKKAEELYYKYMLIKNPYYQHDGTMSVFSKKYKGYIGLSDEEKNIKIRQAAKYDKIGRNPNQKEYWVQRGFSEEDAIKKAKTHINIFSLKTCIEKYGEIEGTRRFNERQQKWLATMAAKSQDEINRINHDKVYKNGPKSGIEYEFLKSINSDESTHNVFLKNLGIVDLLVNNKVIEFYGDYWHCNPIDPRFSDGTMFHPYLKMTASEKWEYDNNRINKIKQAGYIVKIVWEFDYRKNKELIIKQCQDFINEK